MTPPRFLLSTVVLPWPPDQGSRRFTLELARSLRAVGPVTWVSRATQGHEEARRVLEEEGFQIRLDEAWASRGTTARLLRRVRSEWEAFRKRLPRELVYACTNSMQDMLQEELEAHPESIVVGAFWFEAPAVRLGGDGNRVLVLSDLEYYRAAERMGRDPEGPLPASVERLRRAEKNALMSCDLALCLTQDDRNLAERALEGIPYALRPQLGVWPAVIPVPDHAPPMTVRDSGAAQRWLIYGHWSADFNRDGLRNFINQVWPALRRAVPTPPRLRVAGGGLDSSLRRELEAEGAEVLGWVDELQAELADCDAVAVPLDYAGGLRYRMLEAMAAGRPVICTSVAARGSEAVADEHYLKANNASDWSRCWRTLEDPARARQIAEMGHAFVLRHYGPTSRAERVHEVLSSTLGADTVAGKFEEGPSS